MINIRFYSIRYFFLVFPNNNILSCFLFFFLVIDLFFLTPAVIAQISNPTSQLALPTGIPTNDSNANIETHPLTAEMKIRKCSK